jgi:hypothetical protein
MAFAGGVTRFVWESPRPLRAQSQRKSTHDVVVVTGGDVVVVVTGGAGALVVVEVAAGAEGGTVVGTCASADVGVDARAGVGGRV